MLGWDYSLERQRLHIEAMQREADHHRLVRAVRADRQSAFGSLAGVLGRSLILMGARLLPATPQRVSGGHVVVLRQVTGSCVSAADPCMVCEPVLQ